MPDFVYTFDLNGRFTYANEALHRLLQRRQGEMVGLDFHDLGYPEPLASTLQSQIQQVIDTHGMVRAETLYESAFGVGYYEYIFVPIFSSEGKVAAVAGTTRDITDRKLMEDALRKSQEEVERLYAEMEDRVRERTQQLESANREMEGFTYSVSHDLRTPLRAIVSSSRILLDDYGAKLDAGAQHELRRQEAAANKLAVLIDELLKLSRISRQQLNKVPVDLTAVAHEIAAEITSPAGEKVCRFSIAEKMTAVVDPTSVHLLLSNLLENAVKFSAGEARVTVGATESEKGKVFWVRDEGIGFDMKFESKVFLPFERLVTESEFPGTGIGLTNVKRIVERHGGTVWVESAPGKGTTFFFTLE